MIKDINNEHKEQYVQPSIFIHELCLESSILQSSEGEETVGFQGSEINDFDPGSSFDVTIW